MSSSQDLDIDVQEWWLDESALPRLTWARLRLSQDGPTVQDCDGALHVFAIVVEAVQWLRQEEYVSLSDLVADGAVPTCLTPPVDGTWPTRTR